MAVRTYLVQLKSAKPLYLDADAIYVANPGFLFFLRGGNAIAAFPRGTVEYAVEVGVAEAVVEAHLVYAGADASATPDER